MMLEWWCFGERRSFESSVILTAQVGSSVRLEALAKGAAKRVRATMEYFIFLFLLALMVYEKCCGF